MNLCFILGTRPEIIKLSPVIHECELQKIPYFIIHTNQHYTAQMDSIFFAELGIQAPKYNLSVSGESLHGAMTGKMLQTIEKVLLDEKPDYVIVQGDTNTTLAGALAAEKLQIRVAHVEAGLRSYDRRMPEEINRVIADHISVFLFAPTIKQKNILLGEGIEAGHIYVTGNTIVDAVLTHVKRAEEKNITPPNGDYMLLTMHRPSNVDTHEMLDKQLKNLDDLSREFKMPILFPIHPRTRKQIEQFEIKIDETTIKLIEPTGFLHMLVMERNAKLIITDSGGIQEEACILHVPCITIRENTERPETLEVGSNMLVGSDGKRMKEAAIIMIKTPREWKNPFGSGNAGKQIVDIIAS